MVLPEVAMPPVHLVQITDMHIRAKTGSRPSRRGNFAKLSAVVDAVTSGPAPDLVLATGDLVDDASPAAYGRLAPLLQRLPAPVHAIPGNHDDPAVMAEHLAGGNIHIGPNVAVGDWRILLLDTLVPGEVHGHLGDEKLAALDAELGQADEAHVLIALHHPPAPIGSPLDDVGLLDAQDLFGVIDRHARVRAMVWGHNHHVHDSMRGGVRRLGTPSTCVQFDARPEMGFTRTDEPPAYRRLALMDDGTVETEVVWVPFPA